jgi:hypothetical protein
MRILVVVSFVALLAACTVIREQHLREEMDTEMSLCRSGDQSACGRYQLILEQYRAETAANANRGLFGLPVPPSARQQPALDCTSWQALPGQVTTTCN